MNFITVIAIPLFVGVLINLFSTIIINKASLKDRSTLSFKSNSDNTIDNSTYQDNSTKIDNSLTQNNYSTKTTNITNYNNSTASTHSSGEEIIIVGLLTLVISILVILQNYIPIFIGFSSLMILLLLSSRKINHGIRKMSPDVNMILALQSQLKLINFKLVISIVFLLITLIRYYLGSYSAFQNVTSVSEVFQIFLNNFQLASPVITLFFTLILNILFSLQSLMRIIGVLFIPLLDKHHPDSITHGIIKFLSKLCPKEFINKYKFRKYALGIVSIYLIFTIAMEIYFHFLFA